MATVVKPPRMRSVRLVQLRPAGPAPVLLRLELSCGHVTFLGQSQPTEHAAFAGIVMACAPCSEARDV